MKNFTDINLRLCNFCGTCAGICPTHAIEMNYEKGKPVFFKEKCMNCGLCYDHCQGIKVDFNKLNTSFKKNKKFDKALGYYKNCYLGHSINDTIRKNGSSGGSVTQLLIHLLENKMVDGVIIPRPHPQQKWLLKAKIVTNINEVKRSSQSKYCLIPTNEILNSLKNRKGNYAIVLLPCQIHSIRKLQEQGNKTALKIKYIFGLICGYNMEYNATKYAMYRVHINKKDVVDIKYRDYGSWPGGMNFTLNNGQTKGINFFHYHYLNAVYLPYRCRLCPDFYAEYADISFGDSWILRLLGKGMDKNGIPLGWSSLVARTEKGEKVLNAAFRKKKMFIEKVSIKEIHESFPFNILYKKQGIYIRLKYNRPVPQYIGLKKVKNIDSYMYHFIYNIILILGSTKLFRAFLRIIPLNFLLILIKNFKRFMGYPPNARDQMLKYKDKANIFS